MAVWEAWKRERWRPLHGDVALSIVAHPPNRRKRDLDNLLKAPLDAMAHAGVYDDDGQIVRLSIEWPNAQPENIVRVTLGDPQPPTR
jgi:Holliday junction resolvase RusA-like endonuclease